MKIALVSNIKDGIGLLRDAELLHGLLTEWGHYCETIQWDAPYQSEEKFDLTIFCEVLPRHLLTLSERRWICVNPEWCDSDKQKLIAKHCEKVFTKTREAQRIFEPMFPSKVHYVGFMARDQMDENIPRERKFLHIGGNSRLRGTSAVRDSFAWLRNGKGLKAELTIVSKALDGEVQPDGVTVLHEVSEEELKRLQNSHLFHLCPSATEGWGHSLHESLSVGAVILTTDAPPMNEIHSAYKIPPSGKEYFGLADVHKVSALDVHSAIEDLLKLRPPFSFNPREEFLRENENFKQAFAQHFLEEAKPLTHMALTELLYDIFPEKKPRNENLTIAFLGNFGAPESTENMVRWALEEGLGHEVEKLQENEVTLAEMKGAVQGADLFLWVRTPGWLRVSDEEMFAFLMDLPIPSVGLHLDKFFGIPDREELIGKIPFWQCDSVWTADGSRIRDFTSRGVNHHWLQPAASEVYAHRGVRRTEYLCDVGFVGAKTYHSEHFFRGELIDFLEATYGNRFRLIEGGLRGHALNDFYESCRVLVADCFGGGGIPFYWSDRWPETTMRHGFLLAPEIVGCDIPLATFEPENLHDLSEKIDWWLAHEKERRAKIAECAAYVLKHDTWTVRIRSILEVVLADTKMRG